MALTSDARLYRKLCDSNGSSWLALKLHWERATATRLGGGLNVSSFKCHFELRMYFAQSLGVDVTWTDVAEHWKVMWEKEVKLMLSLNNGSQYHKTRNQPELLAFYTWAVAIYVLRKRLKVLVSSDVINCSQNTWLYSHCCSDQKKPQNQSNSIPFSVLRVGLCLCIFILPNYTGKISNPKCWVKKKNLVCVKWRREQFRLPIEASKPLFDIF